MKRRDIVTHHSVNGLISRMFGILAVQYAIGMFLTMFSGDENQAKTPVYAQLAFFAHILFAVMLFVGSVIIYRECRKGSNERFTKFALYGLVSIIVASIGGVMTVILREILSDIGSYIMAIGFLSGFASYGYLFFISRNTSRLAL